jgi:uncharacterized protein
MNPPEPTADLLIVEGIMTTLHDDGTPNIAPMGPRVDRSFRQFVLRPFATSTTYANLKRTGHGVFHVVDDVELLARAAVGDLRPLPPLIPATRIEGLVLADCCRWYELRVDQLDDRAARTTIECRVEAAGTRREFFGFNRAKHAVVEGAILATRVGIVPADEIAAEFRRLAVIVEKTAGLQERQAFGFLQRYIEAKLPPPRS